MSYSNEQWRKAITNLLTKTSKNEIKWEPTDLYVGDVWTVIDNSFAAEIGDKAYVVSQTRTKHFLDEEEFTWSPMYVLSIFSKSFSGYQKIATAPALSSLRGLYEAAEDNLAFNRNALDDLLK